MKDLMKDGQKVKAGEVLVEIDPTINAADRDRVKGFAKETEDSEIAKAALEHPGVVLKRPVGTIGAFTENSALPRDLTETCKRSGKAAKPPSAFDASRERPEAFRWLDTV